MKMLSLARITALVSSAALTVSTFGQFASTALHFEQLNTSSTVNQAFQVGDNLMIDTLVTSATGALAQEITFTVASGVTGLTGSAIWSVTGANDFGPRLVGVNIDILDSSKNVVSSDTFAGVVASAAHSTFETKLDPGVYTLRATGNGVRDSSLDLFLNFAGDNPPAVPSAPIVGGNAQKSETIAFPFLAEDTLYLNDVITGQTGDYDRTVNFTVGEGVTGMTGLLNWAVNSAGGTSPRLVGVNVDLLDSTDALIASDVFAGVLAGYAHSTFDLGALAPGDYKLVASGSAVRDVSFNAALTFTGVRLPETPSVPDADLASIWLVATATGTLALLRRKSQRA